MEELIPGLPDDIAQQCLVRLPYQHFSSVLSVCSAWKQAVESAQFQHQRKTTGLSRTLVVLTQADPVKPASPAKNPAPPVYGLTVYEPESGDWARLPPFPDHPDGLPLFCECAGVGRKLVVIGGWSPSTWEVSSSVHVYDFLTARWTRGSDMPGPARSFFACASDSDGTVFVAGGHDGDKNALRSALKYDVASDRWTVIADMARPRDECKGVFWRGEFWVIGGYCTEMQGRFEGSAEAYDGVTWREEEEGVWEEGVCPRTCAVAGDGEMWRCRRDHLSVADGGAWRRTAEVPEEVRVGAAPVVAWGDKVMVIGSAGFGELYGSYVAKMGKGGKCTWRKVERPAEFTGHVQGGCTIEI